MKAMSKVLPKPLTNASGAAEIYEGLLRALEPLGTFEVEEKKTSLHLKAGKSAFLGVHPRKEGLRLNIVLAREIKNSRVVKSDQVSKSRYHNEIDVRTATQIDAELSDWLKEAYELQLSK